MMHGMFVFVGDGKKFSNVFVVLSYLTRIILTKFQTFICPSVSFQNKLLLVPHRVEREMKQTIITIRIFDNLTLLQRYMIPISTFVQFTIMKKLKTTEPCRLSFVSSNGN